MFIFIFSIHSVLGKWMQVYIIINPYIHTKNNGIFIHIPISFTLHMLAMSHYPLQVNRTSENRDCSQPLVQATTSNKKLLFRAIDDLEDGGRASYADALTFAYEAFKQVSKE